MSKLEILRTLDTYRNRFTKVNTVLTFLEENGEALDFLVSLEIKTPEELITLLFL